MGTPAGPPLFVKSLSYAETQVGSNLQLCCSLVFLTGGQSFESCPPFLALQARPNLSMQGLAVDPVEALELVVVVVVVEAGEVQDAFL